MRYLLQSLKTGEIMLPDVPVPNVRPGHLLIQTRKSLISIGTERRFLEFGQANLFNKARSQPEKVKQVLEKIRSDGIVPTAQVVLSKLDQPIPLGYSNVGVLLEVGPGVTGFSVGDRVLSNGSHSEIVCISRNLCAKIPDEVGDDAATFGVLGAIALQGIRLLEPTIGETVVVLGLGLIGLLTVQILQATGCRVISFDFDPAKVDLASGFGVEAFTLSAGVDPVQHVSELTKGVGADGVIIAANTLSNDPIRQAPRMCRKRGRVILIGDVGLDMMRADFYDKEITFQVSCAYGPGRYDPDYEDRGRDYPIGFVRWTEQRNFETVLDLMASGKIRADSLVTHRISFDETPEFYKDLSETKDALGVVIDYPAEIDSSRKTVAMSEYADRRTVASRASFGFIGAGNFTSSVLLPAFKSANAAISTIASQGGVSGQQLAKKFGVESVTTDYRAILEDDAINSVIITTKHNSHASLTLEALQAGKNVFVEKPLCLTAEELASIEQFYSAGGDAPLPMLMVGFNRRFSPLVEKIRAVTSERVGPMSLVMTVNAGHMPSDHWAQDAELGGGRLLGEGCHFVDLLRFLAGSRIKTSLVTYMDSVNRDTFTIQLGFENGSIGTVHYFANGHKSYPKERLEVFYDGKILILDNFRSLQAVGVSGLRKKRLRSQDKGHKAEAKGFVAAVEGRQGPLIPLDELFEVSRVCIELDAGS